MKLPETFLNSLQGITGFDKEAFIKVHQSGEQVTSIRWNPDKISGSVKVLPFGEDLGGAVPWSRYGHYLSERPSFTFDPLFHAGCYYVQEASSMFIEQAFLQLTDDSTAQRVLDVCAAPGGKSTHIQSLLSEKSLLVSNEVIRGRSHILVDNIVKWGCKNVVATNNDPAAFQKLPGYFDVIVVDAPCSGSGLFRRDEQAIHEWSPNNVQLCCQRQQRILADVMPSLKEDGLLIYSTCSYSREEDEEIMDWLVSELKMKNEKLKIDDWDIVETRSSKSNSAGYRFFPDKVRGEGFFMACFRKTTAEDEVKIKSMKSEKISSKEQSVIAPWIKEKGLSFTKLFDNIIAFPELLMHDFTLLTNELNVQYAGVQIGKVMKDKLVPAHALALSTIISDAVPSVTLSYGDAIKYLQRQELKIKDAMEGWHTVKYHGFNLGWVNALKTRINNYYPKELRILKQYNDKGIQNL